MIATRPTPAWAYSLILKNCGDENKLSHLHVKVWQMDTSHPEQEWRDSSEYRDDILSKSFTEFQLLVNSGRDRDKWPD